MLRFLRRFSPFRPFLIAETILFAYSSFSSEAADVRFVHFNIRVNVDICLFIAGVMNVSTYDSSIPMYLLLHIYNIIMIYRSFNI